MGKNWRGKFDELLLTKQMAKFWQIFSNFTVFINIGGESFGELCISRQTPPIFSHVRCVTHKYNSML